MTRQLPLPPHYNPNNSENYLYDPDMLAIQQAADEWRRDHKIRPSGSAKRNIHLLLIDTQRDFCHPEGTLYVGGPSGRAALEDNRRTAEFIYRELENIKETTQTFDTHFTHQIFTPSVWLDAKGNPVAPHTVIAVADIRAGKFTPNPAVTWWYAAGSYEWQRKYVEYYCDTLEAGGKYLLYVWPYHCQLGSIGHTAVGVIQEARAFHSFVRGSMMWAEVKGGSPYTENYSVLTPEVTVTHDGQPIGQRNRTFIQKLLSCDALLIGGQASSHCTRFTIADLLADIAAKDPQLAKKVYIIRDLMSPVYIPGVPPQSPLDFPFHAEKALQEFAAAGMHVVESTTPMAQWPGLL